MDYIVGFSKDIGDSDSSWDVGLLFYTYPGMSDANFTEVYGGISNDMLSLKVSYSDDFAGVGASAWYIDAGLDYGLGGGFNLFAYAGYNFGDAFEFEDASIGFEPSTPIGVPDYINYGAGVGWSYENFGVDAKIVGTTLSEAYEISTPVFNTETRAVLTMNISFP